MADASMTGEAGANRTFRSIFGAQEHATKQGAELQLQSHSDAAAPMEDEDMWSDEPMNGDADNNDLPATLQFAQRKSMEEWAEEDDEEENWKEALQDRVNQLELAFQHNNDTAAADSRRRFEKQLTGEQREAFSQSLPTSAGFTASDEADRPKQAARHKMPRRSSSHACITGESTALKPSTQPSQLWNFQRKMAAGPTTNAVGQDPRSRTTSIDFVARNIQNIAHHRKRSGSTSSSSSRTDSPRPSLSRKNSMESNRNHLVRSNSSNFRGTKAAVASSRAAGTSAPAPTAVFNLSDTETIRRYVLDDVKRMSMERLVNDAQRLHFLEDFYQSRQGSELSTSTTSSTTVAPPQSPSAMSTS